MTHPIPAPASPLGGTRAWFIWALGALSFGYAFFQRVAPSVMVQDLMREFSVGAAVLGNLSAIYLYAYAGLQIPIGVLIDRWGARLMISLALTIAGAGSLIFALADSLAVAYAGRFLIGAGSAVGFVGTLMLAGRWFAPHRFSLVSGLTMLVAMAAAVGSQAPLAKLVESIGWRATLTAGALAGLLLAAAVALVVRDAPDPHTARSARRQSWGELASGLGYVLGSLPVWNTGIIASAMSATMLGFGALWGPPYLALRYGIERPEAAFYSSFIFFGWAVGAPCFGWLSDRIGRRKPPLVIAALLQLAAVCFLFLGPETSAAATALPIFLAGIAGSGMVNCYAHAREITKPGVDGAVTGFVNGLTVGAGALFQPLIGLLLDYGWDGTLVGGARVYAVETYRFAFLSLVAAAIVSLICVLLMRETYCRRLVAAAPATDTKA